MAKQSGILPIEGTMGNITFFKTKDGFKVRQKGGVSASRILTDPAFARTRENMAEFGRAGKASKTLRRILSGIIHGSTDGKMVSRLTQKMMEVVKSDLTSSRGLRNVIDGEAELLSGFDCNLQAPLSTNLKESIGTSIERATGVVIASIPALVPRKALAIPGGATHYRIRSGAAWVDFESGEGALVQAASAYESIYEPDVAGYDLTMQLPVASPHPLFLVVNLEFVQESNGVKYPIQNGAFNACTIVDVSGM